MRVLVFYILNTHINDNTLAHIAVYCEQAKISILSHLIDVFRDECYEGDMQSRDECNEGDMNSRDECNEGGGGDGGKYKCINYLSIISFRKYIFKYY